MLSVSAPELERLAQELHGAAAAIRMHAQGDVGAMLAHDGEVTAALRSVERDWSRQRIAITGYLDGLGTAAHSAAMVYAAIEEQICAAAVPAQA
jgi:hypothetical protein